MSREKQIDTPTYTNLHQSYTNLTPTHTNSAVGELEQIEEMAKIIDGIESNGYIDCFDEGRADADKIAERLYNAGWRKQSEGENVAMHPSSAFECSECHWEDWDLYTADSAYNFCPQLRSENERK